MSRHRRRVQHWWTKVQTVKLSTAVTGAVLVGAIITTSTMTLQKHRTDDAVHAVNSVADPILSLCAKGGDTAQKLSDAGLCAQAATVKVSPVVANPDSLTGEPIPGPKGDKGARGEPGAKGDPGDPGRDGSPATSMTLNGSGAVYTCRRSGGSNTAPTYNCPGLGGVVPSISPFPGMFPSVPGPGRSFPRPFGHGPGRHDSPPQTGAPDGP